MERLEVSGAVRPLWWSLGVKGLKVSVSKSIGSTAEVGVFCNRIFYVSVGAHQPCLSCTYTQRPYLYVIWFSKELTKEIIIPRSQSLTVANNMVHSSLLFRALIISSPLFVPRNAHKLL
jgi:hypothetical protein